MKEKGGIRSQLKDATVKGLSGSGRLGFVFEMFLVASSLWKSFFKLVRFALSQRFCCDKGMFLAKSLKTGSLS